MAELRRHPLTGDWVVICHDVSDLLVDERQADCIYCPGREALTGKEIYRANGSGSHHIDIADVPYFVHEGAVVGAADLETTAP